MFNIKRFFSFNKVRYKGNFKGEVTHAFQINGVNYFMFADLYKAPYKRMCVLSHYLEEMSGGVSGDETKIFLEGLIKALDSSEINISYVIQQISAFKAKIESGFSFESVFFAASAILIDDYEDAYDYSLVYNRDKVNKWMAGGVDNFFLTMRFLMRYKLLEIQKKGLRGFLVKANTTERGFLSGINQELMNTYSGYLSLKSGFNAKMASALESMDTL